MGRTFIKSLLNSARGMQPSDDSSQVKQARTIQSFADLDGLVCALKVGVELDSYNNERNCISAIIMPDHKDYAVIMAGGETQAVSPLSAMAQASWTR